jgi:hypothetical protein
MAALPSVRERGSVTRLGWWAYGFFVGALAALLAVVYGWLLGDCI